MSEDRKLKGYTHFNILALDGGGVRGVLSRYLVARLDQENPNFLRDVDLIVGTSTGGIQALELASGAQPHMDDETYQEGAKHVFKDSFFDDIADFWKLTGADYDSTNIRDLLRLQFGDKNFSDLNKRVAIVSFLLDNGIGDETKRAWKPKIFHNIERSEDADLDAKLVDVGMATSAAPVYFPTAGKYIDGGVIANNPAMIGLAQALDRRGPNKADYPLPLENINLLSIGTGKIPRHVEGKDLDWGASQWAPHIFDLMFSGPVELANFQCRQILGDQYHRLNPTIPFKVRLDEWEMVPALLDVARTADLAAVTKWLETNWL